MVLLLFLLFLSLLNCVSLQTKKINEQVRRPTVRADNREDNEIFDLIQTDAY